MKVRVERVGSAFLLDLYGRLTIEADTHELSTTIREILQLDVSYVVLDLAGVDQVDCSGIGQLLRLNNQVRETGCDFILINVERRVRHLLQRAGLLAVLPVFSCRQDTMTCGEPAESAPVRQGIPALRGGNGHGAHAGDGVPRHAH